MDTQPLYGIKADLFKALGHPARIRILEVLSGGESSVGEMGPSVGIDGPHLSQQLGVLRRAGVVTTRKDGASVIYSLADPLVSELLAVAKQLLISSLASNEGVLANLRAAEEP